MIPHTSQEGMKKMHYSHNEAFWREPSKTPSISKNGLTQARGETGLGYTGLEGDAGVKISIHRLALVWFEFLTSTKGESGWAILLACLDVQQKGKREG